MPNVRFITATGSIPTHLSAQAAHLLEHGSLVDFDWYGKDFACDSLPFEMAALEWSTWALKVNEVRVESLPTCRECAVKLDQLLAAGAGCRVTGVIQENTNQQEESI